MKGYIVGIVAGGAGLALAPDHWVLGAVVAVLIPLIVLPFWTGAVVIKFEKD